MVYIGRASNLANRKRQHFGLLKYNNHYNSHLQRAYNKYKPDNFIFEVLERCRKEDTVPREQYYMNLYIENDLWDETYNKNKVSSGVLYLSNTAKFNQSKFFKNREFSKLHRTRLSSTKKGECNPFYGTGPVKATAIAQEKNKKRVAKIDIISGRVLATYDSQILACDDMNVSRGAIGKCCRGITKTCAGFKWKYII